MDYAPLDASDVECWIGQAVGGGQLVQPVTLTDVLRWTQATRNPNPLHYDAEFAARGAFGKIVPQQSFILACSVRHGLGPATQGIIPGSTHLNGGDEWWFSERVNTGDQVISARRACDYRLSTTKFAGPTLFQRGDTTYVNQHGQELARQRTTAIRFLSANVGKEAPNAADARLPVWSKQQIEEIEAERLAYASQLRNAASPEIASLKMGQRLPRRIIGPHSIASFVTEQRSFLYTIWGNLREDGLANTPLEGRDKEAAIDPEFADGIYYGASAGHFDSGASGDRGIARAFGTGASSCAYVVDYLANWAGDRGWVSHLSVPYRGPVFVGDVTYVSATITGIQPEAASGHGLVTLEFEMTSQTGRLHSKGPATVRLPMGS